MSNFKTNAEGNLNQLEVFQPDRPKMVAEFWTGWFDHWATNYHDGWAVDGINF